MESEEELVWQSSTFNEALGDEKCLSSVILSVCGGTTVITG